MMGKAGTREGSQGAQFSRPQTDLFDVTAW